MEVRFTLGCKLLQCVGSTLQSAWRPSVLLAQLKLTSHYCEAATIIQSKHAQWQLYFKPLLHRERCMYVQSNSGVPSHLVLGPKLNPGQRSTRQPQQENIVIQELDKLVILYDQ